jgi:hypothetical protein
MIRNRTTDIAQACYQVHATCRWAITASPIVNRVTDLGSIFEFLRIYPFSNPVVFDSDIIWPILNSANVGDSKLKRVLDCVSLSPPRWKRVIKPPPRKDMLHHVTFSPEEREYYERHKKRAVKLLDEALSSKPEKSGQYLNALQKLNELGLICNHGIIGVYHSRKQRRTIFDDTLTPRMWSKEVANEAFETLVCAGQGICSVCGNIVRGRSLIDSPSGPFDLTLTSCLILTCGFCTKNGTRDRYSLECSHNPRCPDQEVSWPIYQSAKRLPVVNFTNASTKLKALMTDLRTLNRSGGRKR